MFTGYNILVKLKSKTQCKLNIFTTNGIFVHLLEAMSFYNIKMPMPRILMAIIIKALFDHI